MIITEIIPGRLYSSNAIDDWDKVAQLDPDMVINVAGEHGTVPKGVDEQIMRVCYVKWHFHDVSVLPDIERLTEIAETAAMWIRAYNHRVLVHDKDGHNRVMLMVAAIMHELPKLDDVAGEDLITFLRKKKEGALANTTFANYVRSWA